MQRRSKWLIRTAVLATAAGIPSTSFAVTERPVLDGRAVLPAATFAPGPPSVSAILPAEPGSYWVMEERDSGQGATAHVKRIYLVDLRAASPDGTLVKTLAVDLMNISDPATISLPGRAGDIGLGEAFSFPYVTIESVLPLDAERLLVVNDNNFPFSTGRNPLLPDYNDFIAVRTGSLKNAS